MARAGITTRRAGLRCGLRDGLRDEDADAELLDGLAVRAGLTLPDAGGLPDALLRVVVVVACAGDRPPVSHEKTPPLALGWACVGDRSALWLLVVSLMTVVRVMRQIPK
jgi:hypothetical protein